MFVFIFKMFVIITFFIFSIKKNTQVDDKVAHVSVNMASVIINFDRVVTIVYKRKTPYRYKYIT